jgi:hypothetical protein
MVDDITLMDTISKIENMFKKIKESKKGYFDYEQIHNELSQKILKEFPDCQKDVIVHVNENHINQDLLVQYIINTIPVDITNNLHNMAPDMTFSIMHVLACKYGISINVAYDEFEFTPIQNPDY